MLRVRGLEKSSGNRSSAPCAGRFRLTERELPIVHELHRFIHKCCLATLILKMGVKNEVIANKLFVMHSKTQNPDELKTAFTISSVERAE